METCGDLVGQKVRQASGVFGSGYTGIGDEVVIGICTGRTRGGDGVDCGWGCRLPGGLRGCFARSGGWRFAVEGWALGFGIVSFRRLIGGGFGGGVRFAEIAGGRDGDFGGIDGDTCGFALGGTAGADQGGVDGGFGIIRAGVNGEAIAWFQEGITDGLAVFATEFGFGDEAEAEGTGSGDLQQEFFFRNTAEGSLDGLDDDFGDGAASVFAFSLRQVDAGHADGDPHGAGDSAGRVLTALGILATLWVLATLRVLATLWILSALRVLTAKLWEGARGGSQEADCGNGSDYDGHVEALYYATPVARKLLLSLLGWWPYPRCKTVVKRPRRGEITSFGPATRAKIAMPVQTILVIDDDESLRDTIGVLLETEGFRAILAADGKSGLDQAVMAKPALIVTDLRLPDFSGVEVCKRLRTSGVQTPIIVLSAIGEEIDKVLLLEIGADDYIVKPFGTREFLARVRAVLRRSPSEPQKILSFGDVEVDLERRVVRKKSAEVKFTPAEYNLLTFFLQNPDRPLSRDMILNSVWGYESFPNTRTVDAHVVRLRQKLETDPIAPRYFITLHKVGYRFLP